MGGTALPTTTNLNTNRLHPPLSPPLFPTSRSLPFFATRRIPVLPVAG